MCWQLTRHLLGTTHAHSQGPDEVGAIGFGPEYQASRGVVIAEAEGAEAEEAAAAGAEGAAGDGAGGTEAGGSEGSGSSSVAAPGK